MSLSVSFPLLLLLLHLHGQKQQQQQQGLLQRGGSNGPYVSLFVSLPSLLSPPRVVSLLLMLSPSTFVSPISLSLISNICFPVIEASKHQQPKLQPVSN